MPEKSQSQSEANVDYVPQLFAISTKSAKIFNPHSISTIYRFQLSIPQMRSMITTILVLDG